MPTKTDLDAYECHHGMGYSTFRSSKNDLQAELTAFVPVGKNCEINQLTLTNNSKETKDFSVFSYVEFCLWNAMDDMTNFQRNFSTGEVEVHGSAIYHKTEYRERRNHYALYAVNAPIDGFDTDRDSFLGAYGENSAPEVVVSDQSKNSIASGWAPVGSHHLKVSLAPGESKTFVFILAYIENPVEEKWIGRAEDGKINRTRAEALMKEFDTKEKSEAALAELKKYWDELLSHFTVSSSEEKLDRMVNIWHQYQCMVTFNMSRSASYFESGIGRGMGFRDSCQDLLGFVHLIPDRARERILDIAATQFEDGSAYHQYQPLTKKGNSDIGSGFNDDPLWLIAGTAAYIKETGDYTILDEKTPYDSDPSKATDFMEHLRRSFHYTIDHLGPHKLPLIGRADWNDCLNLNCFSTEPGESFQTFAHVERHAGTHFGLHAGRGGHGFAFAVLLQHVVRGHVGAVDQFGDLQSGDFEHVLGLPQRTPGHVGHGDHLLTEGVDRDVDRASGFHFDAPFGQLVEDDAPFVGGDEQRVVDVQLQVVLAGDALSLVELNAREVGHGAPRAVACAQLHEDVRGDGHREDDRRDQREVPQQRMPPEPGQVILGFLHRSQVISGPSGKGRRRCRGK